MMTQDGNGRWKCIESTMTHTLFKCEEHRWTFEDGEKCPECVAEERVVDRMLVAVQGLDHHGWEHSDRCVGWHEALAAVSAALIIEGGKIGSEHIRQVV